jgi:hypothetical protein
MRDDSTDAAIVAGIQPYAPGKQFSGLTLATGPYDIVAAYRYPGERIVPIA